MKRLAICSETPRHAQSLSLGTIGEIKPSGLVEKCVFFKCVLFLEFFCLFVVVFKETKPSSQDGGDKKDGEYIKLKVIGQVCMNAGVMDGSHLSCCCC